MKIVMIVLSLFLSASYFILARFDENKKSAIVEYVLAALWLSDAAFKFIGLFLNI